MVSIWKYKIGMKMTAMLQSRLKIISIIWSPPPSPFILINFYPIFFPLKYAVSSCIFREIFIGKWKHYGILLSSEEKHDRDVNEFFWKFLSLHLEFLHRIATVLRPLTEYQHHHHLHYRPSAGYRPPLQVKEGSLSISPQAELGTE